MSEQPFSGSPTGWQHGNTLRRPPCCFPTLERLMRAEDRARANSERALQVSGTARSLRASLSSPSAPP